MSSAPEPEVSPVIVAGSSTAEIVIDGLCGGVTIVVGDGDDEGIVAVEVGVGRPGTGFGVDGSGTVAGAVAGCNGEVSGISETISGISS